MKRNPIQFYSQEKEVLETELSSLKKSIYTVSTLRFLVFAATVAGIYLLFGATTEVLLVSFIGVVLFVILLVKSSNLQAQKQLLISKIAINATEIEVLQKNFLHLDSGREFMDANHYYSHDIDLFGKGSFFQYSNRTKTAEGAKLYAAQLTDNHILEIEKKQEAIKELSEKIHWRQHFSAVASLVKVRFSAASILNYIQGYKNSLSNSTRILTAIFPAVSLLLMTLVGIGYLSFSFIVYWFFIGLFFSASQIKKTSTIYNASSKAKETFKQYYQLLEEIEKESFESSLLKEHQQKLATEKEKASLIFKKFSKILDAFDQRNNVIIAVVGNGLFLWDLQNAIKVEKWISTYKHTVKNWFDVIAFFDVQNTLGNFCFNHPTFVFPTINANRKGIEARELGHPLLNSEKRIDNDFIINKEQFFIVTGANMAGKSTFLRTVSLAIVMSNLGLPVCAKELEYAPVKLITSMRTSDSLADDESYFYSELKRLKFIVEQIKTEDYFIILDEILKGTNSQDKAIGSKKFVEKLTTSKSTGIIATHDVSLCELETAFKGVENYFFDAEINNDELYFDYTLKKGVCQNMNASFLLKKMEII